MREQRLLGQRRHLGPRIRPVPSSISRLGQTCFEGAALTTSVRYAVRLGLCHDRRRLSAARPKAAPSRSPPAGTRPKTCSADQRDHGQLVRRGPASVRRRSGRSPRPHARPSRQLERAPDSSPSSRNVVAMRPSNRSKALGSEEVERERAGLHGLRHAVERDPRRSRVLIHRALRTSLGGATLPDPAAPIRTRPAGRCPRPGSLPGEPAPDAILRPRSGR